MGNESDNASRAKVRNGEGREKRHESQLNKKAEISRRSKESGLVRKKY